jgi:ketopantoate reductase
VCVREEDLAAALAPLQDVPRERLALVQNGFLEPVHGALGAVTRGLVWFTSKGPFFRDLAPTLVHGPRAAFLADALSRGGLDVRALADGTAFRVEMIVKGLWNAVVGLPLAVHGADLATYLAAREDEWRALLDEGARAASAWYGVHVSGDDAARRLRATTAELGWVRGGTKALPWRNGALARLGRACGIATPVNDALLRAAGFDPGV